MNKDNIALATFQGSKEIKHQVNPHTLQKTPFNT